MATVVVVCCCVHLVTSTAQWLHDDDNDAQIGLLVIFKNHWLFNNTSILCSKAHGKNVEQLLKKCVLGGV
jgi:hypothetical protein